MFVGGVLAVGLSTASIAQVTEPSVWQGNVFFTSVSQACTGIAAEGDFQLVVYRPYIAGSPANSPNDGLLLVTSRSAFLVEATHKTLRGKTAEAKETALTSHAGFSDAPTTVEALEIKPGKITPATPVVEILSGTIDNYFNVSGCNIGISGALTLRPTD
jgi:hypothetical protein